ncbi:gastrula zinc finger protein xFG20-1-like isoform X3 [Sitophilus oryzae]|uniref:Gastrula zinc finger protein xFG20-1-like isoform X3 n=1 Tax=Sitophilus oryzae TaxID=7048 RepID=A0A6J2XN21_SITOR|nr:gastrula zinc finger protein xFG20-1-like isoform X3 [Sitophilus oryzae]
MLKRIKFNTIAELISSLFYLFLVLTFLLETMDNIHEVDLKPPTDIAFNNESFSVEHVKQENNAIEENLNGVSSDIKLEPKKIHLAHEERQTFSCVHCDKKYTRKQNLKHHIAISHIDSRTKKLNESQRKVYACAICSYKTLDKSHLNRHKSIHLALEERQMFICAQCDRKYKLKRSLQNHIKFHHIDSRSKEMQKKANICAICDYQTHYKNHLCIHQEIHLAPEERQMFACAPCNKKYTSKGGLQYHLDKYHMDSRNADCTSSTDEVVLDSLKIEMDELNSLLNDTKSPECVSATNEIKSDFIKTEPDDVTPIMNKDMHDDFKNIESVYIPNKVKLEDFIKMEPDDSVLFLDKDTDN